MMLPLISVICSFAGVALALLGAVIAVARPENTTPASVRFCLAAGLALIVVAGLMAIAAALIG